MAQTSPPTITAAPTAPQRGVKATFSASVDAFVTWLVAAVAQFAAVATNVYNNAVDAYNNALAAAGSALSASNYATNAQASADAAAAASGASVWVSGTTYTAGQVRFSPIDYRSYRRKTSGAGSTDPSLDTTNWIVISNTPAGMTLLATLTPTAAATVDFLSVFASAYDAYLIEIEAIAPSSYLPSVVPVLRVANSGVVDTGGNYISTGIGSSTAATSNLWAPTAGANASGKWHISIAIRNTNDATNMKTGHALSVFDVNPGSYGAGQYFLAYIGAAISGFRLYWSNGANFVAQGKVRVYGYQNS